MRVRSPSLSIHLTCSGHGEQFVHLCYKYFVDIPTTYGNLGFKVFKQWDAKLDGFLTKNEMLKKILYYVKRFGVELS